jgi:hypothetical protein
MSSASIKTTFRMIAASFAAGVGAMALVGIVAPVAMQGGLSVREAMATTRDIEAATVIELDVVAVQAQLALAERSMETTRAATDGAMARLERLSGR